MHHPILKSTIIPCPPPKLTSKQFGLFIAQEDENTSMSGFGKKDFAFFPVLQIIFELNLTPAGGILPPAILSVPIFVDAPPHLALNSV
jgi:hypothetical protein